MRVDDLRVRKTIRACDASYCVYKYIEADNTGLPARNTYMNLDNVHKMIKRFLNEKKMTKRELAALLDVTVKNLDQLFADKIPAGLMSKVNLPLVKLYCGTRW